MFSAQSSGAVLSSFFPISITWNHDSPIKSGEPQKFSDKDPDSGRRSLESSIAMRIAYSVFMANDQSKLFAEFQHEWELVTARCSNFTPFVYLVLQEVLECLGDRRILIIADELVQTQIPRTVRNMLWKSLWNVQSNARVVVSSLKPRELPPEISDAVPRTLVQLSPRPPPPRVQPVTTADKQCTVSTTSNSQVRPTVTVENVKLSTTSNSQVRPVTTADNTQSPTTSNSQVRPVTTTDNGHSPTVPNSQE